MLLEIIVGKYSDEFLLIFYCDEVELKEFIVYCWLLKIDQLIKVVDWMIEIEFIFNIGSEFVECCIFCIDYVQFI